MTGEDFASECAYLWSVVRERLGSEYFAGRDAEFGVLDGDRVFVRSSDEMFCIFDGALRFAHYVGGRSEHGVIHEDGTREPRGALPLAAPEWN